ncbi:hypothetical protein ACRC7T_01015 [Segnochrobactraceae bacterium EtOH-i3]
MLRSLGRSLVTSLAVAAVLVTAPLAAHAASKPASSKPVAGITIDQTSASLLVGGSFGGGVIAYKGQQYGFKVGGIQLGGLGAARLQVRGAVYDMKKLEDFAGTYGVVQGGVAAGDSGSNTIWLRNTKGVYIKLTGKSEGLMLNGGVGGIVISWK